MKHFRGCIIHVLSSRDINDEGLQIRVSDVIVDISLMPINRTVESLVEGVNKLRNGSLKLLCLENLHKEEAAKKNKDVNTKDGKENISHNKLESFRNKKPFWCKLGNGILLDSWIKGWFELLSSAFMR